jgi:predicted Rossmann fold flavoprotein
LPAFSREKLENILQEQFDNHGGRLLHNVLGSFINAKIAAIICRSCGIPPDKKAGQISADERRSLSGMVKSFRFNVRGARPLAEAMVTAGGVSLLEIDPRSMGSKLVKDLYFCGEVMDIDADTGGYNLQAAFSTGWLAGHSCAIAGKLK